MSPLTQTERSRLSAESSAADGDSAVSSSQPDRLSLGGRLIEFVRRQNLVASVPTAVILVVIIGLPTAFVLFGALAEDPYAPLQTLSLRGFRETYLSPEMLMVTLQTLGMAAAVALFSTAVGACFAWLLTRVELPGKKLLELTVIAPLFLSPFVGAMAWTALLAPRSGILNILARQAGLEWLQLNVLTFAGVVIVLVMYYVPYAYLFIAGTLRNMDPSLEEASYTSGRGPLATSLRITFPLVRTSILSSMLFIGILAAGMFSVPAILGVRGGFVPLAVEVYRETNNFPPDYQVASAIGTIMVLISAVGIYFYRRLLQKQSRFVTVSGKVRRTSFFNPGRAKWPLVMGIALYGGVTVVLPYAALTLVSMTPFAMRDLTNLAFTFDNFREVLGSPQVRTAFTNTGIVAVAVPIGCVAIGLLTVYVTERWRVRGSGVLGSLAVLPIAVPGIVFGTGLLWLYIRTPLYATLTVIVIAYWANYLPHAIRITGNGLTQIDGSLEEASAVCGASRFRTAGRIVAPLLKPSIFSAAVLVSILSIREINTAMVLYAPDTILASVLAFNYTDAGVLQQGAVVGLLQTLLMIAVIVVGRLVFGVNASRSEF